MKFFIFENLSEEDKLIQKNVKQFCNAELRTNVVKYNHDHFFDKEVYKEFGNLGVLGATIKNYGGSAASNTAYGPVSYTHLTMPTKRIV